MLTTMQRLREALAEHFGDPHMTTVKDSEDLFAGVEEGIQSGLGGYVDRVEMLLCIEREFGLDQLDIALVEGEVSLDYLVQLVEARIEKPRA